MNRSWPIWSILVVCALSILGAMGWLTQRTLSMERERIEAGARAKVEERVRLALSRMDTAASAMLVIENQRPPEHYQPFYQPQALFTNTLQSVDSKLVTQPSPLLADPPEFVQLHFEVWAHRELTSPQVPIGNHRDLAEASGISSEAIEVSTQRLLRLYKLLKQPASVQKPSAPTQNQQEASVEPARDNFELMCQAAHRGLADWNETPAEVPQLSEGWSNRQLVGQLNEVVNNSYNQPQVQSSYQQDLNSSERYKRQQAFEEVQYKAAKVAVWSKTMGKNADSGRREIETTKKLDDQLNSESEKDKSEDAKDLQPLLVNPSSSVQWAARSAPSTPSAKPSAATAGAPLPSVEAKGALDEVNEFVDSSLANNLRDDMPADRLARALNATADTDATSAGNSAPAEIVDIEVTPFRPLWMNDELFVVRRVRSESGMRYQGFWIDAEAMRASLLQGVSDLLPSAKLEPIGGHESESLEQGFVRTAREMDDRSLVTLPWRLDEGIKVNVALAGFTPLHASLGIGWIAVLLAMVAASILVRGVLRMSERRAAFVSSVTHELRTPLTTFQLYSDLLAEGMVPDAEKRQSYLKTMRLEAGRLNHLIENVLSYSRIERGSARAQREKLSVASLLGRFESRLGTRTQRDGARFEVNGLTDFGSTEVDTDVTAVEQIIFNLVDNACKYGLPEKGQGTVRLNLSADRKWVRLSVCDSGHGIRRGDHRKLFRPFHKSAHDAAESKPGVGLGLALCRRLARALGGNLTVDSKRDKGACFVLKLPLAKG